MKIFKSRGEHKRTYRIVSRFWMLGQTHYLIERLAASRYSPVKAVRLVWPASEFHDHFVQIGEK